MTTIKQLLQSGGSSLPSPHNQARLDAEILLSHVLDCSRTYLYAHSEKDLTTRQIEQYEKLIDKRKNGYPVAYLTGKRGFWCLELEVNEHTLIPRPETEQLVELALAHIQTIKRPKILDLGTGSGAIALAMATERPDAQIIATDSSIHALAVAKKNKDRYQLDNVCLLCAHWLKPFAATPTFDLIISNPPYVEQDDSHLSTDIRFEPQQALTSGPEGLDAISEIITQATTFLKPDRWLLIEHGYNQKEAVLSLLQTHHYQDSKTWMDENGNHRISAGKRL